MNLDYHWRPGIDICWDLARGIPCKDSIFSGIFTEHCLEHIPLDACIFLLSECYRVLNQGVLRVIVPDAELYINAYVSRREHAFQAPYYDINDDEFTPLMAINRVFRNFGHRYAYDYETIEILLEKAGFKEIRRRSFLVGSDSRLLIDSESRSVESLYVEAVKN